MKIAIASDHAGYNLKHFLIDNMPQYRWHDLGTNSTHEKVDYPDYANSLCKFITDSSDHYGVLICGTGIGMSIAANRHPDIRAALCYCMEYAKLARQHNNANVLVLGARFLSNDHAKIIVRTFIETEFEGGRHADRIQKL